jgi:hypothetical protein
MLSCLPGHCPLPRLRLIPPVWPPHLWAGTPQLAVALPGPQAATMVGMVTTAAATGTTMTSGVAMAAGAQQVWTVMTLSVGA